MAKRRRRRRRNSRDAAGTAFLIMVVLLSVLLVILQNRHIGINDLFRDGEYVEYGPDSGLYIDASGFTDPGTKNSADLVVFVTEAWENQWGYVWGTYGLPMTEKLLDDKLAQYPDNVGRYEDFIRENWLGRRTADCVGLVKAYAWFDPDTGRIAYGSDAMPDWGTERLFEAASEKGPVRDIPEIPGLLVYRPGHVGVYIGGGYVIEARGTETGVVKTKLAERSFTHWLKCPYFQYPEA